MEPEWTITVNISATKTIASTMTFSWRICNLGAKPDDQEVS